MPIIRNTVDLAGFNRAAMLPYELRFKDFEIAMHLNQVVRADFRRNERGELGTRTASLHKDGIAKLRQNWVYRKPAAT